MPSQQLLTALGEALGSGALVSELLSVAGGSGSGAEIVATDPAYGVVGNGTTDDTAALQRAIDAVELAGAGSVLVIPPGTYVVQDPTTGSGVGAPLTLSGDDITVIAWGATLLLGANGVGTVGGGGSYIFKITGNRNRIYGLAIDLNSGVALATKDNSGFAITGTAVGEGNDNLLSFCRVTNGLKSDYTLASGSFTLTSQGEECFVITDGGVGTGGNRNRIENCLAQDCAWQGFRAVARHNQIINCSCLGHRGNAMRILDGEAIFIRGFICLQTLATGGRSSILCDAGSSTDNTSPENDVDRMTDLIVIKDCMLVNAVDGPDGTVNGIKIAGVRESVVEGCFVSTLGSQNTALRLEDCVHQATIKNCVITPNIYFSPVATGLILQNTINGTVSSESLNLDINGDGALDGAASYVIYTVGSHSIQKGKTVWVRGSSVTEYNGPQQVVAVTATTITTNRVYVSASIGSVAWCHSGVDRVNIEDCTLINDQADTTYTIENLNAPNANIERCRFRNITSNTTKQGHINTEYAGDFGMLKLRVVENTFQFRSTNICRAIRPTDATTMLTSGKTIAFGNELWNDRTSANVYLVDTYDSGDTVSSTYANRATLFASDGDRLSCYTASAVPSGTDVNFLRGDRVRNTAPSSGGAPGWACTTAGAVGTWKAEANLA